MKRSACNDADTTINSPPIHVAGYPLQRLCLGDALRYIELSRPAAAIYLGAHQSALVRRFRRLEHDARAKLYRVHRVTACQPMRPTPRRAAILKVLVRPETRGFVSTSRSR